MSATKLTKSSIGLVLGRLAMGLWIGKPKQRAIRSRWKVFERAGRTWTLAGGELMPQTGDFGDYVAFRTEGALVF